MSWCKLRTVGLQKGREFDKGGMGVQVGRIRKKLCGGGEEPGWLPPQQVGECGGGVCGGRQEKNKSGPVGEEVAEGDDEYEARENGGEKGGVWQEEGKGEAGKAEGGNVGWIDNQF